MSREKRRQVDLSPVDQSDRSYMKAIIRGIVSFNDPPCDMNIVIFPHPDHYTVSFTGWDQAIDDERFFFTFLKKTGADKRADIYEYILSTETVPVADAEEEARKEGPIKVFRIARSGLRGKHSRR